MARNYEVAGNQATTAAGNKTALTLISATTIRPRIYEFTVGTSGAVADNVLTWTLQRFTAAGTTTAVTPAALDPADPAALASAGSNATVEPTYTAGATPWGPIGMNQRATYRWVAAPGKEIVLPATAANGVGVEVLSPAYAGASTAMFCYEE